MSATTKRPAPMAYRLNEVARMLAVSRWTVNRLIDSGELEFVKVPGAKNSPVLIPAASLSAFLDRHTERVG